MWGEEGILAFCLCDTLQQQSHCLRNFVARTKALKALSSGLNLGQPIAKSRGLNRKSFSKNSPGLHNGDLDPTETQQMWPRGLPCVGQRVVREMRRVDMTWCALVSGRRGRWETNLNLLTQLCSCQENHDIEQQPQKIVTDAGEILQSGCVRALLPLPATNPFINGLFS